MTRERCDIVTRIGFQSVPFLSIGFFQKKKKKKMAWKRFEREMRSESG
jgi:hypothetical protein